MQFDSLTAVIQMGGHGLYIWSAYAITLMVIAGNLVWPVLTRRKLVKLEQRRAQREAARQERSAS